MKQTVYSILFAFLFFTVLSSTSCKNKDKETTETTTTTTPNTPVEVNTDDALQKGITDATKDYPGVTANVINGEVTLTGTIERDKLANLMQAVQSLNPKKVNNQLTIK